MAKSNEYVPAGERYAGDIERAKQGLRFLTDLPEFSESVKVVQDVYRLLESIPLSGHRDQLERAATSVICNVCEAAGRGRPAQHLQYQLVARGSLWEVLGLLTVCPAPVGDLLERVTRLARLLDETVIRVAGEAGAN